LTDVSPAVRGREIFEVHCAPCHGPSGDGGYLGRSLRAPPIAGAKLADVVQQVRQGPGGTPVFSAAVISDAALPDLALHVHETLSRPPDTPATLGPRALDPFLVGIIAWFALAVLVAGLAALFAEARTHARQRADS
jgi:mono/diheme cytochrome c family protein